MPGLMEELAGLLPTTGSKWTATAMGPVTAFAFAVPLYLKPVFPRSPTDSEMVLTQLLSAAMVLLLFVFVLLVQVELHYRKVKVQQRAIPASAATPAPKIWIPPRPESLEKIERFLLRTVFDTPGATEREIARRIGKQHQVVLHHFERLKGLRLVDCSYGSSGQSWYPTPEGRTFMVKNGLSDGPVESLQ